MDYSELQRLYMENERLSTQINQLMKHIRNISPAKDYLWDILINFEYEQYLETHGKCPHDFETKDLNDSPYKTILTLIEFFENY